MTLQITDRLIDHVAHALHPGSWSECVFQEFHREQARRALSAVQEWDEPPEKP